MLTRLVIAGQCLFPKLSLLVLFMNECSLYIYACAFLPSLLLLISVCIHHLGQLMSPQSQLSLGKQSHLC